MGTISSAYAMGDQIWDQKPGIVMRTGTVLDPWAKNVDEKEIFMLQRHEVSGTLMLLSIQSTYMSLYFCSNGPSGAWRSSLSHLL